MSSRQTDFFLTSNDQLSLERALRSTEDFVIVGGFPEGGALQFLKNFALEENNLGSSRAYLVRPQELPEVRLRNIETRSYKAIDVDRSPVIEFDGCRRLGDRITRGRMYVISMYFEGQTLIRKDEGFLRWTEKLMSKARRKLKKAPGSIFYYGEEAWQLRGAGIEFG